MASSLKSCGFFPPIWKAFPCCLSNQAKTCLVSKLETSCSKTTWLGVDVESLMTNVVCFEVYLLLQALFVSVL